MDYASTAGLLVVLRSRDVLYVVEFRSAGDPVLIICVEPFFHCIYIALDDSLPPSFF